MLTSPSILRLAGQVFVPPLDVHDASDPLIVEAIADFWAFLSCGGISLAVTPLLVTRPGLSRPVVVVWPFALTEPYIFALLRIVIGSQLSPGLHNLG